MGGVELGRWLDRLAFSNWLLGSRGELRWGVGWEVATWLSVRACSLFAAKARLWADRYTTDIGRRIVERSFFE